VISQGVSCAFKVDANNNRVDYDFTMVENCNANTVEFVAPVVEMLGSLF
jgi:hypothetical protein